MAVLSHYLDFILSMEPESKTPYPAAYLVSKTKGKNQFIFAIRGSSSEAQTGGKQVFVTLTREGSWHCCSCTTRGFCHHKQLAQEYAHGAGIIDKALQLLSCPQLCGKAYILFANSCPLLGMTS